MHTYIPTHSSAEVLCLVYVSRLYIHTYMHTYKFQCGGSLSRARLQMTRERLVKQVQLLHAELERWGGAERCVCVCVTCIHTCWVSQGQLLLHAHFEV